MSDEIRLAVAGLGTVGAGVVDLLDRNGGPIAARAGRRLSVAAVCARNRAKDRGVDLAGADWHDDPVAMAGAGGHDIFVELIGGADGPAKAAVEAALAAGKHVVTANKALIAEHGAALAAQADAAGVALAFEAGVAGGIPIVKAMREGLAGNRIGRVVGILNGTCNYILTDMRHSGRPFEAVLAEAQELGYAEADPRFDVDGIDAAHKLAILTSLAFGVAVDFAGVSIAGIRKVTPVDIAFAEELDYRIKLLGIGALTDSGIEQCVEPCMVRRDSPLGAVDGVYNAVTVQADAAEDTTYEGRGAGAGPTASAVVADIVDIARGRVLPAFGIPAAALKPLQRADAEARRGAFYVRLIVRDRPGVMADIAAALRDEQVSLENVFQRGRAPDDAVPVVLTTHEGGEAALKRALVRIGGLETVLEEPCLIRIEDP
ncbi:MAG: homoserine dehydrogenase [Rhodospirillaceae bacterium]|nr:homoserine dehydrogenase [Rhodospirillaceae bacterium]